MPTTIPPMTHKATGAAEWHTAHDVSTTTELITTALTDAGGRLDGDHGVSADFGSAFSYRMLGAFLPGAEGRLPLRVVVDVRPGHGPEDSVIRAELRTTDTGYLFRPDFLEEVTSHKYEARFEEIVASLKSAA